MPEPNGFLFLDPGYPILAEEYHARIKIFRKALSHKEYPSGNSCPVQYWLIKKTFQPNQVLVGKD